MRLGVLDVGSNTVHLLVVDAHRGAHPNPTHSEKTELRLAEQLDGKGRLTATGTKKLVAAVEQGRKTAKKLGCEDLVTFATSAVREATNSASVLHRVEQESGLALRVLGGEDEARLTFLAVRRWYGWSAGRLLMLDIGGGSLELASGMDEDPATAISLPLGAGRLTREWLPSDPPHKRQVARLSEWLDEQLERPARRLRAAGAPEQVAATSKTFRSLARLTGAAPSSAGPRVRRTLTEPGLRQVIAFISRMSAADRAELEGVSAGRSGQLVAGALVARATMLALGVEELQICPWALREGIILRHLDHTDGLDLDVTASDPADGSAGETGRVAAGGAR